MTLLDFMEMYDNWNGLVKLNANNLVTICEGRVDTIMENNKNLHSCEVVAFGFYDGVLCVRIKGE